MFMWVFDSAILLNFKILYLEFQSEDHPKFCIWPKPNDMYIPLTLENIGC